RGGDQGQGQGGFGGGGQGGQRQGGGFGGGGQGGPGGPGGFGQPDPKRAKEMDDKIKSILSTQQYNRFKQLELQKEGAMAFGKPEIAEKLKLSEDQRDQIQKILEANRPPMGGPGGPGGRGGNGQGGF